MSYNFFLIKMCKCYKFSVDVVEYKYFIVFSKFVVCYGNKVLNLKKPNLHTAYF